jgi:cytochrome P450
MTTETRRTDTFVFDPWDVSWRDDRTEATVDALVTDHPVYRLPGGEYVLSRYADLREVLGDHERFTAKPNQGELIGFPPRIEGEQDPAALARLGELVAGIPFDVAEFAGADVIVGVDPPRHTRIRGIVARGFVPRRIRALERSIDAIVATRLAALADADEFDLVAGLAVPVPIRVIGDILGLGPERDADLKRWSDTLSASVHGPERGTAGAAADLIEMLIEFASLFLPLVEARRADPGDDLISDMVRAEALDSLTAVEAVLFLIILMAAANETTTSLIGNAATYLLAHPDQLERLLADPSLVDGAVEETLRLCAPVQFVYRAPIEDVELHGVTVPAGSPLVCMLAAANRDPRQYPDPHRFDITRRGGSLAFGSGVHTCLGAHLGRVEGRTTLAALAPLLPRFTVDPGALRLDRSAFTRAYTSIPLTRA